MAVSYIWASKGTTDWLLQVDSTFEREPSGAPKYTYVAAPQNNGAGFVYTTQPKDLDQALSWANDSLADSDNTMAATDATHGQVRATLWSLKDLVVDQARTLLALTPETEGKGKLYID